MPLQFQDHDTQRHVDDVDVAVLAATRKEAAAGRPVKLETPIQFRIRAQGNCGAESLVVQVRQRLNW